MERKENNLEKQNGNYLGVIPKMVVMQPTIINVDNTGVHLQEVASEQMFQENDFYDTEQGEILPLMDDSLEPLE